jgi:BolA family transcriptional regulator, general stress-responsive regulator
MSAPAPIVAQIRSALERAFAPSVLEIVDESARHAGHPGARGGGHFRVMLVAEGFRGRSALERHRLVYAAVAPLMSSAVHALNIIARTPDEHARPGPHPGPETHPGAKAPPGAKAHAAPEMGPAVADDPNQTRRH